MAVNVQWTDDALEQYRALSLRRREAAKELIAKIAANPRAGWYQGIGTSHENTPVQIRTFPGLLIEVQFYRWGFFRRNLTIYIYAVRPMDWPDMDEYEERTRQ